MVVDLDDFKLVNDEYGHQRGDRVLQEVAGALMGSVRSHDTVVRHGGDEFAVIAPETDRHEADELAERLRRDISGIQVDGRSIGASTGCAVFPEDGAVLDQLLTRADYELRASKGGRPRLDRAPVSASVRR